MSTLLIDLRYGQTIQIGEASITLAEKSGKLARLTIDAPQSVRILRPGKFDHQSERMSAPILGEDSHGKHSL